MTSPTPSRFSLFVLTAAACTLLALPAMADSHARIVRLSDVQGSVQINKNSGLGFENAFLNMPITQGVQLRTGANGRAEIEFEDGSSMRLAPDTSIEFNRLGADDSGKRSSEVDLAAGMAYVNWMGKDDFALSFAHEKIALDRAAHFRVDASPSSPKVAVFKGDVDIEGPSGKLTVEKKKTAVFDAANDDKSSVENKVAEAPLDQWDRESVSYHDQYAKNNQTPLGYGASDLGYYGAYTNVPGYGMMWQPYFAGVGWDPFMNGAWGWYPGYGYMFASAYPWGWMPYYYGNWAFAPGYGWGWQPGGFNTWHPIPHFTASAATHVSLVVPTGEGKTVFVGKGGATSTLSPFQSTVKAGSAGMGIARGSLTDMKGLNHQVEKSGFARVESAPQFAASSPSRSAGFGSASGHSSMSEPSMGRAPTAAGHASSGSTSGSHH
jgi:FecR protein